MGRSDSRIQLFPVVGRNLVGGSVPVQLDDGANEIANERVRAAALQKRRESLPGGRAGRLQHGISLARFGRQAVGPGLSPAGVALPEKLQQIDLALEDDLRQVMLMHVDDG